MPPVGFEPTIPARERLQTHALDGAATGIGEDIIMKSNSEPSAYTACLKKRKVCVQPSQ
jgi:hypothetical protein